MEFYTTQEAQEQFENLIEKVENGERIGIVDDDGRAAVMVPIDDELIRLHTTHNDAS